MIDWRRNLPTERWASARRRRQVPARRGSRSVARQGSQHSTTTAGRGVSLKAQLRIPFLSYTAIFKSLLALNATFFDGLILIASPVAGLRPMRAARLRT